MPNPPKHLLAYLCLALVATIASAQSPNSDIIQDVTFENVSMEDSFWKPWQEKQTAVTIPAALKNTEPAVENLKIAGEYLRGNKSRKAANLPVYVSSDLYKIMESAAYSLMITRNPELEKRLDEIIDAIASAQKNDGYLYVPLTCGIQLNVAGKRPYSNLRSSHELYNVGHMYEGAVAYYKATGKDKWLKVSEKNAQHVDKVFFHGDPNYNNGQPVRQGPGHQEIELALCKLSVVTGNSTYLELARKLLDVRGTSTASNAKNAPREQRHMHSQTYSQQHIPVTEQREPVGHAVRALYMYTGMAAVDALAGTSTYNDALDSIWDSMVSTRIHITGGLGAVAAIEGFGAAYELPNKSTYNETCAAVANVFFNHRMFLRTRDAKYLDVLEVSLFNSALSGISLSGDRFFYENPLEADGVSNFNHGEKTRSAWLSCACCPPNISRLLMQVSGYFYSHDDSSIWVALYGTSSGKFNIGNSTISLKQESAYPYEGSVKINLTLDAPKKFALRLRIPTWTESPNFMPGKLYSFSDQNSAQKVSVKINGTDFPVTREKGFAVITREWKSGDEILLDLPMPLRRVQSDPRVQDNRGFSCFTRGPLVLCAEEADNDSKVQEIYIPQSIGTSTAIIDRFSEGIMKGIPFVQIPCRKLDAADNSTATLIPYFAWNNRGGDSMRVWLPDTAEMAEETSVGALFSDLKDKIKAISTSDNSLYPEVLFDGRVAEDSEDMTSCPFWKNDALTDKEIYVQIDFKKPIKLNSAAIYFIKGKMRSDVPASWKIQYISNGSDKFADMKIYMTDTYDCALNKFNLVHPEEPLECTSLRFLFTPQKNSRVGASEIQLTLGE